MPSLAPIQFWLEQMALVKVLAREAGVLSEISPVRVGEVVIIPHRHLMPWEHATLASLLADLESRLCPEFWDGFQVAKR